MIFKILTKPDDLDILARLARLTDLKNRDADALYDMVKEANDKLNKSWKTKTKDADLHRLQGAGQVLEEILAVFDEAKNWYRDKVQNKQ